MFKIFDKTCEILQILNYGLFDINIFLYRDKKYLQEH